jgi:Spy/CpxP family protein refolding chaperone
VKIWKVILATLVIFGAGIVVGGLLGQRTAPVNAPSARAFNPQNQNPGQFRLQQLLRRLERELALTAEQDQHIKKIIATSQERTKEMMKPVTLEVGHETTRVCDAIRDELTPEQKVKFDTIFKEHSEHGERGGRRRPPGGPTNSFDVRTND